MMTDVTSAELTQMRSDLGIVLPDTCNILSGTWVSDGQGGGTTTWGTASASVDCRLDNKGGEERQAGGAIQAFSTWILTVPHDTTLTATMRVEHGTETYNIKAVDDDSSWLLVKQAVLERV